MKRRIVQPTSTPSLQNRSTADLIVQARQWVENGRWREAINVYKQLIKQDPGGGWTTPLAKAYEKRAEELAGKGMFKESLILLDNAQRLTNRPSSLSLRLTCLLAAGRPEQVVAFFVREETGLQAARPEIHAPLQEYVAVALLTTPELKRELPADSHWHGHLEAARHALNALAASSAELEPLLGRISLKSPFKPLRLILKALSSVHEQQDRAMQLVAAIPVTSPWAALSRLVSWCVMDWESLLRRLPELSPLEMESVCAWRGIQPTTWRRARELLTASPDKLLVPLTDPAQRWPVPDPALRRLAWLSLVMAPAGVTRFEHRFGPLDESEKLRLSALARNHAHPRERLSAWQRYLRGLKSLPESAERNRRMAMTYRFLAGLTAQEDEEDPSVADLLEQSIELDPGLRTTHLALLVWHRRNEDDKCCRQVLDRALDHFPNDADFLYEAVRMSLKNQTFKKASRLAKRLLSIDPLHAGVRQDLIGACLAQARKQVRGGRTDLAEKELAEAVNWQKPEDRNGLITLNQAFLAWLTQRQEEGNALLEQGIGEAGGGVSACLRAHLEGMRMGLPSQWLTRLLSTTQKSAATAPISRETILAVVRVAHEYLEEERLGKLLMDLSGLLTKGCNLNYSVEEMRSICLLLAKTRMFAMLDRYATRAGKSWRDQVVFVYYRLLAKYRGPKAEISSADRRQLERALDQAEEQNDRELVTALNDWLFEDDPYDDDEMCDFGGMPDLPRLPKQAVGPKEMLTMMLLAVASEFMLEHDNQATRAMARQQLLDFMKAQRPPADVLHVLTEPGGVLDEVLNQIFSPTNGVPFGSCSGNRRRAPTSRRQLVLDLDGDA